MDYNTVVILVYTYKLLAHSCRDVPYLSTSDIYIFFFDCPSSVLKK